MVAKMLALYAFDRSYTPLSQDKAAFTRMKLLFHSTKRISYTVVMCDGDALIVNA